MNSLFKILDDKESIIPDYDVALFGDFCPFSKTYNDKLLAIGKLNDILKKTEIVAINLECPITESNTRIHKTGPSIKAPLSAVDLIRKFGFNLCNLANNHIMDYGSTGIRDTVEALESNSIEWIGIDGFLKSSYRITNIKGRSVAFVSFTENEFSTIPVDALRVNSLDYYNQYSLIHELKKTTDYVIVQYHGGVEFYEFPTPLQKQYAHFLIDIGASMVVCHHSHCVSGYEVYNNSPIFYGLGNFYFHEEGQSNSWFTGFGLGIKISTPIEVAIIPVFYDNKSVTLRILDDYARYHGKVFGEINEIISSDLLVSQKWEAYCRDNQKQTLRAIFRPSFFERVLSKAGWSEIHLLNKASLGLLNSLRCESHREKTVKVLMQIIGE